MPFPYVINAFSSGEISPSLYARVDIEGYQRGAALIRNAFVDYHGGVINRSGTQFLGKATSRDFGYSDDQSSFFPKLIPFIYDRDESLVLVLEHLQLRFLWKGGFITEPEKTITGITKANPGVVTSVAHGYSNNNMLFLNDVGGMAQLNGRYVRVANATTDTYTMIDEITGAVVNTTGYTTFSGTGKSYRVYTVVSPYAAQDLWSIKFVQSRDVMTFTSPLYAPYHLTRQGNVNWVFTVINFKSKTVAPGTLTLSASMSGSGTGYSYIVTATNRDSGEESEGSPKKDGDFGYWTADDSVKVDWASVTDADFYTVYRASVVKGRNVPNSAIYGQVGQTRGSIFNDGHNTSDWALTPPQNKNPFDGANKYPSCVTYVQQRAAYGASLHFPYRIWFSPTGAFNSMNKSLPPRDTDAVQADLASQRADPISNILSMPAGLLCMTTGGVYHVYGGGEGEPITPSNINIDLVLNVSASFVTPLVVDLNVIFPLDHGKVITNLLYNFNSPLYESFDLSILSSHFFALWSIVDWAYADEPHKLIWAVRSDGRLLTLTYFAEQKIYAWALSETEGFVKSVCAIPEAGGMAIYLAVDRPALGITTLERMAPRVFTQQEDAWFVDCGEGSLVNYMNLPLQIGAASGNGVTATALEGATPFSAGDVGKVIYGGGGTMTVVSLVNPSVITVNITRPIINLYPSGLPRIFRSLSWSMDAKFNTYQGLYHLEGKQVWGLADGNVVGPLTVTNGIVTLPAPASRLILGLKFVSRLQTLPIEFSTRDTVTVQDKRKNVPSLIAKVSATRGIKIGPSFEEMEPWAANPDDLSTAPPSLLTGDRDIIIGGGWSDHGQICVEQSDPLPMQVSGLVLGMELGDT